MTFYWFSGKILLCILPSAGQEALHSVKWHSKQYNTVAVASENDIYVLNILEAARYFEGEPIMQSELHRFVQSFRMPAVSYMFLWFHVLRLTSFHSPSLPSSSTLVTPLLPQFSTTPPSPCGIFVTGELSGQRRFAAMILPLRSHLWTMVWSLAASMAQSSSFFQTRVTRLFPLSSSSMGSSMIRICLVMRTMTLEFKHCGSPTIAATV